MMDDHGLFGFAVGLSVGALLVTGSFLWSALTKDERKEAVKHWWTRQP